jgi:hypothetical protein
MDFLIDAAGTPWLTEVESGPTISGLFDGGLQHNPVFETIANMIVQSVLGDEPAPEGPLAAHDLFARSEAKLESAKRGRFELIT